MTGTSRPVSGSRLRLLHYKAHVQVILAFFLALLVASCTSSPPHHPSVAVPPARPAPVVSSTKQTPQVPPTRPAPVVPPSDLALIGQTPTKSYGNLTVTPLAADFNTACEGQFHAGQTVQIQGGGYAPQATVSIELTSLGHGSKLQQDIASVRTNSGGSIQTSVQIPLATVGITISPQSEGMAFIDAIGISGTSAKTQNVDTAIIGIAKASSQCGK